ncbi:LacI family DNA-binding transcriptional regulator [Kocuria sp. SM24M-10]|uniref:LacI family DNA-binding transcriptional regulator n=1 Tax=Kocuria sp. SM24M-10 TaxID=1660349 RepID=UPI000649E0F9|nr:LacI family DNA-binding transcriptional regulator [Kocuria sp. SM24M-10]KLU10541.1 LacI family transcriptional regulator [Kocuria sp. SM24M-10]
MTSSRTVGLADVAREAGVSLATASRALNSAYGVAAATRERVTEVARRLEYVASPEASRLATGATRSVALVVPHLDRWYFGEMVGGLEEVLREAGHDVLLYHVGDPEGRHAFFERLPARRKVDAVVVVAVPVTDHERRRLELMGVTIVAAGGQDATYPYVSIDDAAAVRQATDHLLRLGHRRIAMITAVDPDRADQPAHRGRTRGFYAAMAHAGVPADEELVVTTDWGGVPAAEAMEKLLSVRELPTAVLAHSDEMALGAMRTVRRAGLRVPEDISVIGIDDHPLAELVDLTTVRQPVRDQGLQAARLLLALLRGEDPDPAQKLPTRVVVRRSTAPVRDAPSGSAAETPAR